MKKWMLVMVLISGTLAGFAGTAFAEELEGRVVSMDSKNKLLVIAPAGSSGREADVQVSVSEFMQTQGPAQLNDLDIGAKVSMTVRRGTDGRWNLVSLNKTDIVVPTVTENDKYLKKTGPQEPPGPLRDLKNLLRTVARSLAPKK